MNNVDWAMLISAIMDRLIISQAELATRCDVAQQTVSAWKNSKRVPSIYAQRRIAALAEEAGVNLIFYSDSPPTPALEMREDDGSEALTAEALEFARFLSQAPADIRREIVEYAKFKVKSRRDHGGE